MPTANASEAQQASASPPLSGQSQKKKAAGPTDYSKWDKFDPKAYGYDSEEEREAQRDEAQRRDPRFMREQHEQYKATLAEMDRTKRRIAELEEQQKVAEAAMTAARQRQERWSTYGVAGLIAVALVAFLVPQVLMYVTRDW